MSDLIDFDEKRILRDLRQGNFKLTFHAENRMFERNITIDDITSCAKNLLSIKKMEGKYRVKGHDIYGDEITIVCIWIGNTLIITLF